MSAIVFLLLFLGFTRCGLTQDAFIFPPAEGVDVLESDPVTISWLCDASSSELITLTVWQNAFQSGDAPADDAWRGQTLLNQVSDPGSFIWKPSVIDDLPIMDGFHFQVNYSGNEFNSGALFIRTSLTTTSTTASPTPTSAISSSSAMSTSSTTTTPSSSPTPTLSATPQPSKNDNTLNIGLGVGLGIGIPLLLACGVGLHLCLCTKRAKHGGLPKVQQLWSHSSVYMRTSREQHTSSQLDDTEPAIFEAPRIYPEMRGDGGRWEMPA